MIDHDPAAQAADVTLIPIAEQAGLLTGKQVKPPSLVRILPIHRLVDRLTSPLGDLTIFQYP